MRLFVVYISENLVFKRCLDSLIDINAGILTSKTIFRMPCKFFSMYLAIKKPDINKTLENRAKSIVLLVRALKNLTKLLKPKNLDLNSEEKVGGRLVLLEQDLIIIILFGR